LEKTIYLRYGRRSDIHTRRDNRDYENIYRPMLERFAANADNPSAVIEEIIDNSKSEIR